MYRIVRKQILGPQIVLLEIEAPRVARKIRPGQFIILRVNETGERVPFTAARADAGRGTVTIVFQLVGKTTQQLAALEPGEAVLDLVGPLGVPSEIRRFGRVVCVAGGAGIAYIFPEIQALREAGNEIVAILGARTRDLLFFLDEIRALSDELHVTTDDGSFGRQGLVTDVLGEVIARERVDRCLAAGPLPMLRAVVEMTREPRLPTIVSLDPIMVDGTGMCGSCRVTVGGETKFACVDGPSFDGHAVDFDELARRKRAYRDHECKALEAFAGRSGGGE